MRLLFCYPVSSASSLDYVPGFNLLLRLLLLLLLLAAASVVAETKECCILISEMWAGLRNAAGWDSCRFIFTPGSLLPLFSLCFFHECAFTYGL